MSTSYKNLAIDAISKCIGYDPYLPQTEAMVLAWAESLEAAGIDTLEDILMGVRVMYRTHGDPGWRPTPKILVETARECRKLRLEREAAAAEKRAALQGPERITLQQYRERHPDVQFPSFGKSIPRE